MSSVVVEEVCTVTAKGQTTVPKAVRQALGVGYGGRIAFRVERGRVTVHALPAAEEAANPALASFLALLEGGPRDPAGNGAAALEGAGEPWKRSPPKWGIWTRTRPPKAR